MASTLRYADFQERLSLRDYKTHVKVALADLWGRGELSDRDICDEAKVTAIELEDMRKTAILGQLKEAIVTVFQDVQKLRTYQEHIARPSVQDRLFRRRMLLAMQNERPEIAEKAGKTLEETIMPKQTEGSGQKLVMITAEDIKLLRETSIFMRQLEGGPPIDTTARLLDGESSENHPGIPGGGEEAR